MYVCGLTPKAPPHLGHARVFVVVDVLRRYLAARGQPLRLVQNFTDVDDKIIARAQAAGIDPLEYARLHTESYFRAMDRLHVARADLYTRVTASMPAIIEMVQRLIERRHAYQADGDVYFAVGTFPSYGRLSGRTAEDVLAGARIEVGEQKRDPRDFALWKAAKPGEPWWDSPWGKGRPGWHIECSAMILGALGEQIDLHAGGADLIFPHHENEIAQSEAYTGRAPFVQYWFHVGLLRIGSEKMSHSLNNYVTVEQLLDQYSADAIRAYLLSLHYRHPLDYDPAQIATIEQGLERLRAALRPGGGSAESPALAAAAAQARERFFAALDDDLSTPAALATLYDLAREINRARGGGADLSAAQAMLRELAGILGLELTAPEPSAGPDRSALAGRLVELLLSVRGELRAGRQWALADRIREELGRLGVRVQDGPQGSTWEWE